LLPVLPPGEYSVTIAAAGFRTETCDHVEVAVTETTQLNAHLQVGGPAESVTVRDGGSSIQAAGPQLGRLVPGDVLSRIPLATRNFTQVLGISPGTAAFLPDATGVGRNTQAVAVNGARVTQNNYRLNGVDANTLGTNGPVLVPVPAPETIEEFEVQTSTYDASYGRAGGGNIQILTRSGSDHFHGAAYEYFRNEAINANDGFLKSSGVPRPLLRRSVFGGTFGGPVKPGKAFFFVSYQGAREKNGASLLNSISSNVLVAPGLTDDRSAAALTAAFNPPGPIDPRALALLNARLPDGSYLIPTPAASGSYTASTPSTFAEDQFNSNLDWQVTAKDLLSAKIFFANTSQYLALPSFRGTGPNVPGFGSRGEFNNRVISLQEVHVFSPSTVNEARIGYTLNRNNTSPDEPVTDAEVGIPRSTAAQYPGLPLIRIAPNAGGVIVGTAPAVEGLAGAWTWTVADTITAVRGRHTLRFGAEGRVNGINFHIPNFSRGQIDFQSFTTFLLGQVQSSTLGTGLVGRSWRAPDFDLFVQDEWRVRPRLTVTLGLRYERDMPVHDTIGRLATFDPTLYVPRMQVSGGVPVGPPVGGFVQAGNVIPGLDLSTVPNVSDNLLYRTDKNNFAPRVGFAWSPLCSDRFVVRGGYGIYYSRPTFQYASLVANLPPYYVLAVKNGGSLANPFFALPSSDQFPTFVPGVPLAGSAFDRDLRTPYFHQFSLGVQYEVHQNLLVEVAYVGSRGARLFRQVGINQARLASLQSPILNQVTGLTITTNTPGNAQLRAPLQGVSINGFTLNQTSGQSSYDSLQIGVTRRTTHGLQLLVSYTWSKSIDDGSGQGGGAGASGLLNTSTVGDTSGILGSQLDERANRGVSDFDRTHRFVAGYIWDVPVRHGGRRGLILGGWQVSGIATLVSGPPIDVVDTNAGSLYGLDKGNSALARPSLTPGASCATAMQNIPAGYYFNSSAFADPVVLANQPIPSSGGLAIASAKGTDIGNVSRNCLRGPTQADLDFGVARNIGLGETRNLQFRVEFFNLLNEENLANPISNLNAVLSSGGSLDPNTGAVISGGNFGRIVSSSANPRIVQLSVSFRF
jgi:hypothetical protein